MACCGDARSGVVIRSHPRTHKGSEYCEDCALSVEEPINPTAAVAFCDIELELHMLGAIGSNGKRTWNKKLLCSIRLSEFTGIADDLRPRVIQIIVREMKQSKRTDGERFVQCD